MLCMPIGPFSQHHGSQGTPPGKAGGLVVYFWAQASFSEGLSLDCHEVEVQRGAHWSQRSPFCRGGRQQQQFGNILVRFSVAAARWVTWLVTHSATAMGSGVLCRVGAVSLCSILRLLLLSLSKAALVRPEVIKDLGHGCKTAVTKK